MKGRILGILRAEKAVVSGEVLSAELSVSRVSVWKHIQKLKEFGYHIESTPKGYRLISDPDALLPWEFPHRESRIHYFDKVSSTMDIARDLARKGCPGFTVVVAGEQTEGRGRLKRAWLSSSGGLYFTIVLRPQIPPILSARVHLAAAVVLTRTLRRMFAVEAMVKWPNDILVDDGKIAGMLTEMEAESDLVHFVNIGLGINVNNDPTSMEPTASSLKKILGKKISRRGLLSEFMDEFENYMNRGSLDDVIPEWKRYARTLNRHVRIVTDREIHEGIAVDVDDNGALILALADGSTQKVVHGDCFHQERSQ
ncbi:MAG: biotin--[acetyl-CoA-carboxylase] ligase [Proteobacteria bacterium]|nr:biotin--[acetyl-CoA-carboxylase] ligase [Pseudomonadota bacterium]